MISNDLVLISAGLKDTADLLADISQAFEAAMAQPALRVAA